MSSFPIPARAALGELTGTRYELVRLLGEGAAGAVYLARDRETGEELALKQLFRMDQRSVQRFKREFRSLADMHHPNCVKLYDLQHAGDTWFLTMEYVAGEDLGRALVQPFRSTRDAQRATLHGPGELAAPDPAHIARIAHTFSQLAQGVRALHQAGLLHRDLKPSNVLLAKSGRVVVLDFGLVRGVDAPQNDLTLEGTVAGTPAYMPPEQAVGDRLSPASDWYAFGVMLYEALSGRLPIDGNNAHHLVQLKLTQEPQPLARDLAPRVLVQLCAALLEREPGARPGADEILSVLGQLDRAAVREVPVTVTEELPQPALAGSAHAPFFGRQAELEELHEALTSSRMERNTAVAHVHGASGSGKSSLIEHFLAELQERSGAPFVLRSRCYEREAMPFKALDSVMDALVWHLSQLDDIEVAHLLPVEVAPLAQLFPVLERLRPVQRLLASGGKPRADAAQLRSRAEQGLRELIAGVAERHGLVLWIDDLQWGDLDSSSLLRDWLTRPFDAPVLLLLSYRSEEIGTSPCLAALLAPLTAAADAPATRFELGLTPLTDEDVRALCEQRLGSGSEQSSVLVARIVREARGNAFLASQLAALAHAMMARGEADLEALSIKELVLRTSALLSEPARELLIMLAIAGRPLAPQIALTAANAKQEGRVHIHALHRLRLLRTRNVGDLRLLEVYHDGVREALVQSLSREQLERYHDRLLRTVEASGRADPGWLHELALGAGQRLLALHHGRLAADLASASLAFERAAELYARCASLAEARADLADIWQKLAPTQARCRRGALAAEAYLRASELVDEPSRLPLLQQASSHLLRSGRYEQGEQLVCQLLAALGIELPSSRAGCMAAITWEMTRARWLLRSLEPRVGAVVPADVRRQAEYCSLVALDTHAYMPLRAAVLQTRALRMAFQYGETEMTARALALSATLGSMRGTSAVAEEVREQLDWAARLALEVDKSYLQMEVLFARALCGLSFGKTQEVIDASNAAKLLYESKSSSGPQGDYHYMFALRALRIVALQNLGQHAVAAAEQRELLILADATSNRAAVLQATLATTIVEQALDQCVSSRVRLDREREALPRTGVGLLHVLHMASAMRVACMTGEYDWASGVIAQFWPEYQESPLRRSADLVHILHAVRARLLLNQYVARPEGDPARLVREDLRLLKKHTPEAYRVAAAARVSGRLAQLRGDSAGAIAHLRESMAAYDAAGAVDEAARDHYALGALSGSDEGAGQRAAALKKLQSLGVAEPLADVRGYYPELVAGADRA